jgi:CBS domain-containing protein
MGTSEFEDAYEDEESEWTHQEREEQQLGEAILDAPLRALDPAPAIVVSERSSIRDAIKVMIDNHIGAVLVEHEGRPVGIFTERDVLRRVVISGVSHDDPVSKVMTPDPEMLGMDDGIAYALNRMIVRGFRHVPVLDAAGKPAGVLSVRSVVAYIVSLLPARVLNLPPEPRLEIPHTTDGG